MQAPSYERCVRQNISLNNTNLHSEKVILFSILSQSFQINQGEIFSLAPEYPSCLSKTNFVEKKRTGLKLRSFLVLGV